MLDITFIIPARTSSSRLPGKCCLDIVPGLTTIELIVHRLEVFFPDIPKILLTSKDRSDDALCELVSKKFHMEIIRGDLADVAGRLRLIKGYTHAIRINADNVYLNADYIQRAIDEIMNSNFKFVSNVKKRTYAEGHSVEIVDIKYFKKNYNNFSVSDKEHVFTYFYSNWNLSLMNSFESELYFGNLKLALDTPQDYEIAKIYYSDNDLIHEEFNLIKYNEAKAIFNSRNRR